MNTEHLVQMANDIGRFFAADPDRDEAMRDIASHLKHFWAPQMREEIVHYLDTHDGAGLVPIVYQSLARYREQLCGGDNIPAHDMWTRPQGGSDAG
jgi:formate dehydrogenase subunit delta